MSNRLEVQIGNKKLVAEVNDWSDELPNELCVFLVDENGRIIQDICVVREHYSYNAKNKEWEINSDFIDCRVWGDSDSEDFTDDFCIGVYEENE